MSNIFTDTFGNKIYNDDVLKAIKKEKKESFDLILSDPPYNINYTNNRRIKTRDQVHGVDGIMNDKDNLDMIEKTYKEYFRILKEGKHIYIFTRWDVAQDHIDLLKKAGFNVKNNLVWDKGNMSMGDLWGDYGSQYENILFCVKPFTTGKRKGQADKLNKIGNRTRHSNILKFSRVVGKSQIHSHQKPIGLLQFLIQKSTKTGEKVYDGFVGSNSLGISATLLGRKYRGVELNEDVFETLQNHTNNVLDYFKTNLDKVENHLYIEDFNLLILTKTFIENLKKEEDNTNFNITNKISLKNKELLEYIENIKTLKYKGKELYIINI